MAILKNSLVSYPKRGPWGKANYRGNVAGHLVADLIDTYSPNSVMDPMEGSGTTGDVCADHKEIQYFGYDLKDGYDLLNHQHRKKILDDVGDGVDLIFWHPPYWEMIIYHEGDPQDLAFGSYDLFLMRMQDILRFLRRCISGRPRSRLALLIGDYRKQGQYYWMSKDLVSHNKLFESSFVLDSLVIKQQHEVTSGRIMYNKNSDRPLIRIMHETMLILRPF